jgi:hypothetical protein
MGYLGEKDIYRDGSRNMANHQKWYGRSRMPALRKASPNYERTSMRPMLVHGPGPRRLQEPSPIDAVMGRTPATACQTCPTQTALISKTGKTKEEQRCRRIPAAASPGHLDPEAHGRKNGLPSRTTLAALVVMAALLNRKVVPVPEMFAVLAAQLARAIPFSQSAG